MVLVFFVVVFVIVVGASASDFLSSFVFFSFVLLFFFVLSFCFWRGVYVFCFCVYFLLLFIFLLLCFLLFITYVIISFRPLFPVFLRVSRLIVLAVVCCLYSSSFSFCVFLLPRPPRALEKQNNGQICLSLGDVCENVLSQHLCLFFVDFFHPQNMFLLRVLGICSEEVRDSLLFLFVVFLCFGVWNWAFFRSNLSLVLAFFGFVVCFFFFSSFFLGVSAYVCVFLWVLVC